jgi:hypothetical protein
MFKFVFFITKTEVYTFIFATKAVILYLCGVIK